MMQTQKNIVRALSASSADMLTLGRDDLACYALDIRPVRHGKSLTASTHFPAWYLGRHPDRYVIGASDGQDLADDFGRRVRNTVASPLHRAIFPETSIAGDSAAVHRFNLTAGGAYSRSGAELRALGRRLAGSYITSSLKFAGAFDHGW
jgi:hypothetical protein